jgi:hypothetical protein
MKWRLHRLNWRYAIGELLIVVSGVMIALYADQWNNRQSIKLSEIEYIERLVADLDEDQISLERANDFLGAKLPSLQLLFQNLCTEMQTEESSLENLQHFQRGAFLGFSQPFGRRDTYDEMIATGAISIIRNVQIRTALLAYVQANEVQRSRTVARMTDYPSRFYELAPYSLDISELEADKLWSNIRSSNICNEIRAEQNFGAFVQSENGSWKERQQLFLQQLETYLSEISE